MKCLPVKPIDDFIITKAVGDSNNLRPTYSEDGKTMIGDYTVPSIECSIEGREKQLHLKMRLMKPTFT